MSAPGQAGAHLTGPGEAAAAQPAEALVRADGIVKVYRARGVQAGGGGLGANGPVRAVAGVTLEIRRGECYGLIGESGSGKSTLGRILLRLTDATDGKVLFDGADITHVRGRQLRRLRPQMNLVFQNPHTAVNRRRKVLDVVSQPLKSEGRGSRRDHAEKASQMLSDVGVARSLWQRLPHELSGGQMQRVVIARALISEPDFIVADEPTASLDVSIRAQIINLLTDIQARRNIAMLFISHDLRTVSHIAHRIAVMYRGQLVEVGDTDQVTRAPMHPYTRNLVDTLPRLDRPRVVSATRTRIGELVPAQGCAYRPRCPIAVQTCEDVGPVLEDKGPAGHAAACHLAVVQAESDASHIAAQG
jgi:oligopeptide/dipeptide ABC transporter ATP-binding protein